MARDFPGSAGNYVDIGDVAAVSITGTALTIHAWIRPDVVNVRQEVVAKYTGSASGPYLVQLSSTGKLQVAITDGAGEDFPTSTASLTAGSWSSVALRKSGTGAGALKGYINGVEDGSATSNRSMVDTANSFRIGAMSNNTFPFDGRIGEVAIWDVALTPEEILALSKGVSPLKVRPVNLKGYWPLWGVAYPEPDLSGSGNNGTQTGTVNAADHAPVGPIS